MIKNQKTYYDANNNKIMLDMKKYPSDNNFQLTKAEKWSINWQTAMLTISIGSFTGAAVIGILVLLKYL